MRDIAPDPNRPLTMREREVLALLTSGYSIKEVSGVLNTTVKTAEVHKYNLMRKLGLHKIAAVREYGASALGQFEDKGI